MLTGAVKVIEALPFKRVAVPIVGASGVVAGVTELDAAEALPAPTPFIAVTVNVYAVPFVKPLTVQGLLAQLPVMPLGVDVAV